MGIRKTSFIEGEYYHIYNRGVDKRDITLDQEDSNRFLQSMVLFNTVEPIGSIHESLYGKNFGSETSKTPLVTFVAYCLNPNHYHFLLTPLVEKGVEHFMQRFGTGYTKYFNNKHKRTGGLFGGVFRAEHVSNDDYLLTASAYINCNNLIHAIPNRKRGFVRTSFSRYEYAGPSEHSVQDRNIAFDDEIVLSQFKNIGDFRKYAKEIAEEIKYSREQKDDESLFGSEASK